MMLLSPVAAIEEVAGYLHMLTAEVVFVGGAVASLLITDPAALPPRPTRDVDVIVEITTRRQYNKLEEQLRSLHFRHDTTPEAPLCRWHTPEGTTVDVMPLHEEILGFSNRWYGYALRTGTRYRLPSGTEIRLIAAPAFLATKLDAFQNRGSHDYYASHDLEDIVALVNGREEVRNEIARTDAAVRVFIANAFEALLRNNDFRAALPCHLPYELPERIEAVEQRLRAISAL